ncbi:unnamed protein product [Rotaria socialis]|uniref:Band 7 domain-containing protein n=2 Tax=Rotaria socialis TaxID=392032 RepID=A0A819YKI1_9BILA|nr:unnamed protein product [Rotaria socialis]CAF3671426.1 unnamed protein product [Rotaria socialis]CAF4111026.1 unnamed protein product [Rotaria socialis]CAF4159044.1 unnamed protein product [Rotaria socialis]
MASSRLFNNIGRLGIGLAIAGGAINSMLYNVDGGHRAVIFDRFQGVKPDVIGEGTHFMIPWLHRPIIFDIRTRPRSIPSITGTKDLQTINITLRILYRPRAEILPKIFTNLGLDYEERVLPSITNEVLKSVVAQFDAIELITQRTLISQRVSELLTERAAQFGLLLDDISITHVSFGPEFTSAVELKQVAQQDAEKQRFLVEKAEQSRQANVIAAEGDARAADLIGKALGEAGDGLIELRRIEAAEDIAGQLSKSRNIVYLPHGPQMLLNISDDIKDSSTIERMNFDNIFRRFILTQSFVRGWGNPLHLQEIFMYRRDKIGVRDECLKLVPAESVQDNTIEIVKQEIKGDCTYIHGRFRSPLADYLPNLVPPEIATAHFQLILPRDHRLGIDPIPIGLCYAGTGDHGFSRRRLVTAVPLINQYRIASILLENPYYGLRKPPQQSRSSLFYVTDLYIMGKALILETLVLLHWCQKMKLTPAILHGFSLGGHMASLAFTNWPGPLSLLSCASWSTSSTVYCDGVLSRTIPWALLKQQFYENKAYQTFYEYLRERNRSTDSNVTIADPIKDMMRLLMDEFTSLFNYSRPVQSNISNALFIACINDGYIIRDGIPHMNDLWPGCHIRYIPRGHISAFLLNQSGFHDAVAEMLQRQQPDVKLKKYPIITPASIASPGKS